MFSKDAYQLWLECMCVPLSVARRCWLFFCGVQCVDDNQVAGIPISIWGFNKTEGSLRNSPKMS